MSYMYPSVMRHRKFQFLPCGVDTNLCPSARAALGAYEGPILNEQLANIMHRLRALRETRKWTAHAGIKGGGRAKEWYT